jgi:DNA-binding transcriptional LysR family regulator
LPQPPRRSPDLGDLRTLVAAADSGTLGRAAIRLRVSQPALSKRLQALEQLVGVELLERSQRGVTLTPAGRMLYEQARPLLAQAELLDSVVANLRRSVSPVRLAASHSAAEAFVRGALATSGEHDALAVELVIANSYVVRTLVADGRADVGVAPGRPGGTPHPGVQRRFLADDRIVCAVPRGHRWAQRPHIRQAEFLATPMVVRDPTSNARWTVDAELRRQGLAAATPLAQASTPDAAQREALKRDAPLLLSEHVIDWSFFARIEVDGLVFPRRFELVLPASVEPNRPVRALIERLEAAVADWTAAEG